jgi:CDP-diacylglycerol pyrophosphatase
MITTTMAMRITSTVTITTRMTMTTVTITAMATITTTVTATGMSIEGGRARRAGVAATIAGLLLAAPAAAAPDPARDVLWMALKTCVLAKRVANRTFPCLTVDLGDKDRPGSAVLRAPGEPTHIVVMPTDTVIGLEAPVLRGSRGVAYWRAALAARHFVSDELKDRVPEGEVALAVNSARGRSQDQLHIHLDCLRPKVVEALNTHGRSVGASWKPFPVPLAGDRFLALRVRAAEVETFNPFTALTRLPGRKDLTRTSFAAVATRPDDPEPGFLLLAYRAPLASAEDVMDHSCAIAGPGRPRAAG